MIILNKSAILPIIYSLLIFINVDVKANYDIDYKIILDIDNINANYQLSPDVRDIYYIARTRVTILDLNIVRSYYPDFSKSKESAVLFCATIHADIDFSKLYSLNFSLKK